MKITKLLLVLLIAIAIKEELNAQVTLEWVARYDGLSNFSEYVSAMALDSNGNVYVTGTDSEEPPGFVTIKFDANGQFVWAKRYSGGMSIMATPKLIEVDLQCNVYVGASDVDYIIIKYDSNGVQQWVKRYRGSGGGIHNLNDLMIVDDSFSIIQTGHANFSSGFDGCFTMKMNNATGDSIWSRRYTPNPTICVGIDLGRFGDIHITGTSSVAVLAPKDFLTLSYDLDGNLRWVQTWDGPANRWDEARDVVVDNHGNVYVTGYAIKDSLNNKDIATIKYDSTGNGQWIRFYDGTYPYYYAEGRFIKTDPYGNIIVAGWQAGYDYDFCTIKYDSLGNQLWVRMYNGAANRSDFVRGLAVDQFGSVYVTGTAEERTNFYRIHTIKYDKHGNQQWIEKYPDSDTISGPAAILVDDDLNVYVAGTISFNPSDIIVLKYSQSPLSVEPISKDAPKEFVLYQNYSNPFNPTTIIKYDLPEESYVTLKVYNLLGQEVAVLVDEFQDAGYKSVEWNAGYFSSGVYIYRIIAKELSANSRKQFMDVKKMLVIK